MTWRFRDLSGAAVTPGLGVDIAEWKLGRSAIKRSQTPPEKEGKQELGGSGQLVKQYGVKVMPHNICIPHNREL
jgi:hypothetical protein